MHTVKINIKTSVKFDLEVFADSVVLCLSCLWYERFRLRLRTIFSEFCVSAVSKVLEVTSSWLDGISSIFCVLVNVSPFGVPTEPSTCVVLSDFVSFSL